jgi:hypothetical protein
VADLSRLFCGYLFNGQRSPAAAPDCASGRLVQRVLGVAFPRSFGFTQLRTSGTAETTRQLIQRMRNAIEITLNAVMSIGQVPFGQRLP